jgi:hypothetical protein
MSIIPYAIMAFSLTFCPSALAATTAGEMHAHVAKAIGTEASAQAMYQQWSDDRESLTAELRDMKAMDAWLKFQNVKYEKYIHKQEGVIAELEHRKEEAKRIRRELEPFLETVVDSLEGFVVKDLPFLAEERTQRIHFLRASLDDYHLELSEKLRRVFEALLVETEYGRSVSTSTEELDLQGTPTQVSVFRLGRTALFYQTSDGSEAGKWDREANSWRPLDASFARTLQRARDMADRKRAVELLSLPVGEF